MNSKLTTFQIIFLVVMAFSMIAGVFIFSIVRSNDGTASVNLTAWGTIPKTIIDEKLQEIEYTDRGALSIVYTEFSNTNFEEEMIEALASGQGPDLVFMSTDLLVKHQNKLFKVPYESYPQRTFKSTFIEAGDVLLDKDGVVAFPYMIDPLVLYWNRAILNSKGIANPPAYWNELIEMTPRLTTVGNDLRIVKSAISFGEYRNVKNAKEIIVTLINQSGNTIVKRNDNLTETNRSSFIASLNDNAGSTIRPVDAALNYFTQFSNPTVNTYTWNRSLPNSEDMFLAGDLAFYIGYASEYPTLRQKNPNLNFDVAVMPQSLASNPNENVIGKKTVGKLMFVGIVKNSKNIPAAFSAINILTSNQNMAFLTTVTNLPPVRRDLIAAQNSNAIMQTFYDSAMIASPFLDPEPASTNQIFLEMIESFTSGRSSLSDVINRANSQIGALIR